MSSIYNNRGIVEVSEEDAIKELGESFVKTINHIRSIAEHRGLFMLVHGTQVDNCKEIINDKRGLWHYSNEYDSMMSSFNSFSQFYNCGLINGQLPNGFIVLLIPRKCFFRTGGPLGLWHSLVMSEETNDYELDDSCSFDEIEKFSIPSEYIFGYVDLKNKHVVTNNKFCPGYRNNNLIFDAHTFGSFSLCREKEFYDENVISDDDPDWGPNFDNESVGKIHR